MKIIEGGNYEDLCAEFQYQWIVGLRAPLKKHGVPAATARDICGEFTFDLSMLFDQGELDCDGKSYRPVVGFTDDDDTAPVLVLSDGTVDFHEYAFGTTAEVFDSPAVMPRAPD